MISTLERAVRAWKEMEGYREDRRRCKRYVFGDQWGDVIDVGGGVKMTETEAIRSYGQIPLKNNILRRIMRNVIGVYRASHKMPEVSAEECGPERREEINRRGQEAWCLNRMDDMIPRLLEEFLLSGLTAVKVLPSPSGGKGEGKSGVILPVTADNFFFHSDGYDPRGWDVDLIGEIHCVSYGALMSRFCKSPDDLQRLEALYGDCRDNGKGCRLAEVWVREEEVTGCVHDTARGTLRMLPISEAAEMLREAGYAGRGKRLKLKTVTRRVWRHLWLAHQGSPLAEEERAQSHPYVMKAYPFVDGEMHSYISDIIDQQRYVNRLITLYDFIMKSSAKGVLLFPDDCLPRGWDLQDVADEWSRFNGVLPYRAVPGVPQPSQVSVNATNIGIAELLKIEMQMLEDISGVSPTLQGKLETAGTSGTLFTAQNQAAQTSLLDVLRSFEEFQKEILLKCIMHNA